MDNFEILNYPRSRRATFDVGKIGLKKHHIAGLLEIDVTNAKKRIKESKSIGKKVSFNSWFVKVVGNTVAEYMPGHAIKYKNEKLVAFKEVDISIPIERKVNGKGVPIATIIRNTNQKTIEEINSEIQTAIRSQINNEKDFVLTDRKNKLATGLFFFLPQWVRMIIWKRILKNPFSIKKNMGTVIITNVSMFGDFAGWIIPKSIHNLSIGIGSIVQKPWVVKNNIEIRDILHLTILFDHDAIDGAPATRFTQSLVHNLESAIEI
jgi:pyruvate/2-oxoglutarate dehydrogenase complex dihydrolipoamide acyltransferase (E2) component